MAKEVGEILSETKTDKTIRQCSCGEQHSCFEESKHQLYDCLDECWGIVKQITNSPERLRTCLRERIPVIDNFFGCMEKNLDRYIRRLYVVNIKFSSCASTTSAGNVTYIDYNKVINSAEDRVKKQTLKLVRSVGSNIQRLVNTALSLGTCAKNCYTRKNSNGFCFDRTGCQPKIEIGSAIQALKKCAATIKWKETAGEACQCAVEAGVDSLKQYCNILKTIERGRNGRNPDELQAS